MNTDERRASLFLIAAVACLGLSLVIVGARSVAALRACEAPVYLVSPPSSTPLELSPPPAQNNDGVSI